MPVSTATTTPGALVTVPVAAMAQGASIGWMTGRMAAPDDAERMTTTVAAVDPGDSTLRLRPLSDEDAARHGVWKHGAWVHVSFLRYATPDYPTPTTAEETAMPTTAAAAVTAALAAQREEHQAEIARLTETHHGAVAAQRSNAQAAARITRDEEIGEALAEMVDDGTLDADTASTIADRLSVEIPTREYEVDVTITITQTIRVKASNASAAAALAASDESFVQQSLQIGDGISIDGDDDLEVLDDGANYSDPSVDVSNIQRV